MNSSPPSQAPEPQAILDEANEPSIPRQRPTRRRSGLKSLLIVGLVLAGAAAVAVFAVPGLGDSLTSFIGPRKDIVLVYRVSKGSLPVTVLERGSLESSNNKDAINEVEGSTTIISILEEGKPVKKGDLVCELDSAGLRDQLVNQEIATKRSEADLEQAKKTLEVAEIGVREYLEGTFPESEQSASGQIKLAESELIRAEERLEWSERMLEMGYVTQSQNMSDRLSMQKAEFQLREAETKLKVLREYTREKQLKELEASVEKARSDLFAKQSTHELEKEKENKLVAQIEKCQIFAPGDGLVVYANDSNRFGGSNTALIEEGATVRERQRIFSLPDISQMRVNTKVHESMVDRVKPGMKARIRVEAFPDALTGTVESVAPLADPTSFFSSDIKQYTTLVRIDNPTTSLRPGFSAEVEILVTQLDDVLSIPVQAILQYKGKDHVFVQRADGTWDRRVIKLGISNDKLIEVTEGLTEDDEVALSPLSLMTEEEKREAFAVAGKSRGEGEWSSADVQAGVSPGQVAVGGEAGKAEGAATKKRAGGAPNPAMFQKMQNIAPEDREKMRSGTDEERKAILKKAGFTDEELKQLEQMRGQMGGAGGAGGPPGGGGPGGGGGGGGRGGGAGGGEGGAAQ